MNSMNGSWSFSGCCGRRLSRLSRSRGGRGARGARGSRGSRGGAFGGGVLAAFVAAGAFAARVRLAGGGDFGVGIGADASLLAGAPRLRAAVRVAWRLFGPRTGDRST